jgi:Male sterility protein/SCP-2 sterol transfer family
MSPDCAAEKSWNPKSTSASKLAAEKLVRSADFINPPTIYRPGIIIGDSETGFTTTYHGFYAALQLAHTLAQTFQREDTAEGGLQREVASDVQLNLNGDETKHLVPVDWVSAAMTYVITHPEHHASTYHLTPQQPITTLVIRDVLEEAIGLYGAKLAGADYVPRQDNEAEALFHEHIRIYNSYWRMDPEFDCSNIQNAAPHLPCPAVDYELLLKLSRVVIAENFPGPAKKAATLDGDAGAFIQPWTETATTSPGERLIGLDIRGPGGGQWQLVVDDGQLVAVEPGLHAERSSVIQTDVGTFVSAMQGEVSWNAALASGAITLSGQSFPAGELIQLLDQLAIAPGSSRAALPEPVTVGDE